MSKKHTIALTDESCICLRNCGKFGETFSDLIAKLIENVEQKNRFWCFSSRDRPESGRRNQTEGSEFEWKITLTNIINQAFYLPNFKLLQTMKIALNILGAINSIFASSTREERKIIKKILQLAQERT